MAAGGKQDGIARFQDTAFQVVLVGVVEVHPQPALSQEQHFLGVMHLARHWVMDMRFDDLAGGMTHVGKLLREIARGEEMNARFAETVRNDQGEELALVGDGVDHVKKLPNCRYV